MKLKKALAQRIKSLREAAGLSQQDVATRGQLSVSLVAKLEQGKKADPRTSTLLALATALQVRPGALLEDLFPPDGPAETETAPEEAATNGSHASEASNGSTRVKKAGKARKEKKPRKSKEKK